MGRSEPAEPWLQFLAQMLDGDGALVDVGQIVFRGGRGFAELHGDVRDHDAVFAPELFDLPLAAVDEVIEIMHEKHALARGIRRAAPPEENVVSTLSRREELRQMPLRNNLKARKTGRREWGGVHRCQTSF